LLSPLKVYLELSAEFEIRDINTTLAEFPTVLQKDLLVPHSSRDLTPTERRYTPQDLLDCSVRIERRPAKTCQSMSQAKATRSQWPYQLCGSLVPPITVPPPKGRGIITVAFPSAEWCEIVRLYSLDMSINCPRDGKHLGSPNPIAQGGGRVGLWFAARKKASSTDVNCSRKNTAPCASALLCSQTRYTGEFRTQAEYVKPDLMVELWGSSDGSSTRN